MIDKETIINLTETYLQGSSSYLVDVLIGVGNTITVEIDNDEGVDIDQCAALSRHLEANLDREVEDFELTVTSVGLTSPFKTLRQYKKFEGEEVEVLTKKGEKLSGTLESSDPEGFTVAVTKKVKPEGAKRKVEVVENIRFAFNEVKHTKYLIRFK
ncbi:MAG: ribosome assembly cofactor RimP [Bacteroidota bacterium]|jgi:ribosome maturation factor RimP|nr:ribosome assembly cofactor RimP [Bacteroidota bacterium]HHU96902.1 ribosome assembly cofactor RimP [Petrimonas sp.]